MVNKSIVFVDDEAGSRELISLILEEYDVVTFDNAKDALAYIAKEVPFVVITDINMPGMDGMSLLRQITSETPEIPVILFTGHADKKTAIDAVKKGAFDFIEKPCSDAEVLVSVERAVNYRLAHLERIETFRKLRRSTIDMLKLNHEVSDIKTKLEQSSKLIDLGEMASGIIHEINGPLLVIRNIIEKIRKIAVKDQNEEVVPLTEKGEKYVNRMFRMIKGMRAFSRDGVLDPLETVAVRDIVDDTLELCEYRTVFEKVKIYTDEIPDDLKIQCRVVQISQVILNLLNNAQNAVEESEEKWVKIKALEDDGNIVLTVTDSGPGIKASAKMKIFDRQFTTKGKGSGSGLGLSISKKIVESHHGKIALDEDSDNTCFRITLPKTQPKRVNFRSAA